MGVPTRVYSQPWIGIEAGCVRLLRGAEIKNDGTDQGLSRIL